MSSDNSSVRSLPRELAGFVGYRHWLSAEQLFQRVQAEPIWNWPPVYAALLDRWLGIDSQKVLGQAFAPADLI